MKAARLAILAAVFSLSASTVGHATYAEPTPMAPLVLRESSGRMPAEGPTSASPKRTKQRPKQHSEDRITAKESAAMRRRAREAIRGDDLELARRLLRKAAGVRTSSERQAWWVIEAELEYSDKQYAKAGLVAMRLVILHADSKHVGDALYWAARSYEGLERPHKAIQLHEECLAHGHTKASIRKLAKARLAALQKRASAR
ncbi:MAG: hypothetical protein JXQ75_16085 [Phycisphaerae bacterium]|nr:hypothetical protein [Phycisphaerae bacterium]